MEQVKQTATEWLYEQLTSTWFDKTSGQHILEQAKAMHREEIINSFFEGAYGGDNISGEQYYNEQYYNEQYGGNK
jgi:hypothetical protein